MVVGALVGCASAPDNAAACATFDHAYDTWVKQNVTINGPGPAIMVNRPRLRAQVKADNAFVHGAERANSEAGSASLGEAALGLVAALRREDAVIDAVVHNGKVDANRLGRAAEGVETTLSAIRETCPAK
jgi:hypothetical protein